MIDARRETPLIDCAASTPRERAIQMRLAAAGLLWGVCFTGARYLIKHDLLPGGVVAWLVAALPAVAGAFLLFAYTRYLREIDELQRAIQLQALAIGFGGGFLAICAYVTLQPLGAPAADPFKLLAVMPVLYALAMLVAAGRYR